MKRLPLFLLLISFVIPALLTGQEPLVLYGKIVDKTTKKAIAYAHIGIPEKGIGTISGHDGRFTFKLPRAYAHSTLVVSFIGYKTYRQPIETISIPVRIELVQTPANLTEVVVTDGNQAEDIIRKAVKAIPKNYPTHPTKHLAFYRESCTDDSLQYRYMAEGVINVYKRSYTSTKEGQVSLIQGRRMNLKNPLDTLIRGGLDSGHMAAHRFDFVQNREDFINKRFFPVYKYWIEKMTTYNDRLVYVIGFGKDENATPKPDQNGGTLGGLKNLANVFRKNKKKAGPARARLKGRVYIDAESYAFIRAEFEVTQEGLRKTNDYPLYSGSFRSNTYVVNYRQLGDKWYFSDALREGNLRGEIFNNEIKITQINTEKASPIPYLDRLHRSQSFTRLTGSYDPGFWASYNTTPMSAGLSERIRQLENDRKAAEIFQPQRMLALEQQRDSIRLAKEEERLAQLAEDESTPLSEFDFSELQQPQKRRRSSAFQTLLSVGTHLITSEEDDLTLTYLTEDGEVVFSLKEDIPRRQFEVISHIEFDIYFRRNYFVRTGIGWDYLNSIYRDWSVGTGASWNLSRKRPVFFKAIAQYSFFRYGRKMGIVDNDFGKFKERGKKFNSKTMKASYGSKTHNLKLSAEISIELRPDREFFLRGTYFLPFARRNLVWLKERGQFFNKKKAIPIDDSNIVLTQNNMPFGESVLPNPTFSISFGWLFE